MHNLNNHHLLLSLQILLQCRIGPIIEACMQAIVSTTRKISAEKQYILLRKIKNNSIATNDIEHAVKKLTLSQNAKSKLRSRLMNGKIRDALRTQAVRRVEERVEWKKCKRLLPGIFLQGYLDIWYRERTDIAKKIDERHKKKLNHLLKKWDRTPKIPDAVCGVEVDPDISGLDGEFSSEARLYGNVTLDEEEKQALELPPKFGVYRKLDPVQCKIDVEES